jgi:plasmid replication initiation protein
MCKQYLSIGKFEKKIDDIRTELELGKMYCSYKYMARDLLHPAEKEINEQSDIRVAFEPVREGRTYVSLNFRVWAKPDGIKSQKQVSNKPAVRGKTTEDIEKEYHRKEDEWKEKRFNLAESKFHKLPKEEQEEIRKEVLAQTSIFDWDKMADDSLMKRSMIIGHYIDNYLGGVEAWYAEKPEKQTPVKKKAAPQSK